MTFDALLNVNIKQMNVVDLLEDTHCPTCP